ncbi:MAG TPA: hypothetical protein VLF94_09045, partial [Chlamydiales bacterium]|nr:hypothetical protein [Chlamydiales bacterium]
PFDTKNTRKQAENQSPKQPLARTTLRTSYRGWPVSAISLVIQNIASIIVLDKLKRPHILDKIPTGK